MYITVLIIKVFNMWCKKKLESIISGYISPEFWYIFLYFDNFPFRLIGSRIIESAVYYSLVLIITSYLIIYRSVGKCYHSVIALTFMMAQSDSFKRLTLKIWLTKLEIKISWKTRANCIRQALLMIHPVPNHKCLVATICWFNISFLCVLKFSI